MTDNEIRIAIAESEGWKRGGMVIEGYGQTKPERTEEGWTSPKGKHVYTVDGLPNYLQDLNAISQVVATITDAEYDGENGFTATLAKITQGKKAPVTGWRFRPMQEAAARQRAEAYLRAKGLWKE